MDITTSEVLLNENIYIFAYLATRKELRGIPSTYVDCRPHIYLIRTTPHDNTWNLFPKYIHIGESLRLPTPS